jgi:hypothetical protein
MTRSHKLTGVVAAFVVVTALAVTAFITHNANARYPKMQWVGSSLGSGNSTPGPPSTSWVFGSFDPCVTSGSVTVTGFKFTKSSNFVMTDWGYQVNHHSGTGVHPGTITSSGLHHGPATITNTCADTKANTDTTNLGDLFAVQVRRVNAATGWSVGLDVTYRSGGSSHVSHWPLGFALCGNTPLPHNDILGDICTPASK